MFVCIQIAQAKTDTEVCSLQQDVTQELLIWLPIITRVEDHQIRSSRKPIVICFATSNENVSGIPDSFEEETSLLNLSFKSGS